MYVYFQDRKKTRLVTQSTSQESLPHCTWFSTGEHALVQKVIKDAKEKYADIFGCLQKKL